MSKKQSTYKKRNIASFIRTAFGIGILGIIVGIAGAIFGASRMSGLDGLALALIGLIIGYPIGVIIGIIWTNKVRHYYGSLLFGVIGSILGTLLVIGLEEPLNLNLDPIILFGTFFLVVPLLCVIGFYLKSQPKETS